MNIGEQVTDTLTQVQDLPNCRKQRNTNIDDKPNLNMSVGIKTTETDVCVVVKLDNYTVVEKPIGKVDQAAMEELRTEIDKIVAFNKDQMDNFMKPFREGKDKNRLG